MHDESLLLRCKSLLPKICHFQIFKPTFKCVTLCIILITLFHIPFGGKRFNATRLFVKINTSYLKALIRFILKLWPVYMTDSTLNVNNNVDICLIPLKFHMWMSYMMTIMYTWNQWSISSSCAWWAVHNRTFWMTLVWSLFRGCSFNFIFLSFLFIFLESFPFLSFHAKGRIAFACPSVVILTFTIMLNSRRTR